MNEKRVAQLKESILKTIENPDAADSRKNDCYAQCANHINKNMLNADNLEIWIYGFGGYPTHGVVVDKDKIVFDSFSHKRLNFNKNDESIEYDSNFGKGLEVVEKITSEQWKYDFDSKLLIEAKQGATTKEMANRAKMKLRI